jgi:glycosyltransferase involved in cell wall biosynthesis
VKAILIGKTERDHEFAADVMKALPAGLVELSVCTHRDYHSVYRNVPGVKILPFLSDAELLEVYQRAELLFMPFLDCTTNDALMEAMACGTPVMTNRVGGIPEYVASHCNIIMDGKIVSAWADRLVELARSRHQLWAMREPVRRWAEKFSWKLAAAHYQALYEGESSR